MICVSQLLALVPLLRSVLFEVAGHVDDAVNTASSCENRGDPGLTVCAHENDCIVRSNLAAGEIDRTRLGDGLARGPEDEMSLVAR